MAMKWAGLAALLFVAHATPLPAPLHGARPMSAIFGVALVLAPARGARSLARIGLTIDPQPQPLTRMQDAGLDGLRTGNQSARSLPLLAALARRESADLLFPGVHGQALRIRVEPA